MSMLHRGKQSGFAYAQVMIHGEYEMVLSGDTFLFLMFSKWCKYHTLSRKTGAQLDLHELRNPLHLPPRSFKTFQLFFNPLTSILDCQDGVRSFR